MWRNTALRAELFAGLDGRVGLALVLLFINIRLWTLLLFLGIALFFFIIKRNGYSLDLAMLRFRSFLIGSERVKRSKQEYNTRLVI